MKERPGKMGGAHPGSLTKGLEPMTDPIIGYVNAGTARSLHRYFAREELNYHGLFLMCLRHLLGHDLSMPY